MLGHPIYRVRVLIHEKPFATDLITGVHLDHYTPCPNSSSITNPNTWQNNHIATDPAILTNMDFLSKLRPFHPIPDLRIQWMRRSVETYVRTD